MRITINILVLMIVPFYIFAENVKSITIFGDKITEKEAQKQANIVILTSDEIKRINPKDTLDLLNKIPGVDLKSYDNKHVTVNIGGFVGDKAGLNNVIMVNGRRITNPDMANPDLTTIPVDSIERIEVYLGGNSVLFGDRATGGAINIVTKKPTKNSLKVKVSGGSYGLYDTYAEGVLASENYAFLLSGNKFGTQGYRDNSELYTGTINGEFSYFTDKLEITINGSYTDSKYGLPGDLTLNEIAQYGRKHTKYPNDGGHDFEWNTGLKISYDTIKYGKIILDGSYKERYRNYEFWGNNKDNLTSELLSAKYELTTKSNLLQNIFQIGFEYENYDSKLISSFSNSKLEREIKSYFVYDKINWKNLFAEIGYRSAELDDDYISSNKSKSMDADAYTIAVGYNLNNYTNIYIRADKSFRFPTTDEINEYSGLNTQITEQETYTYEIGLKTSLNNYFGSLSAMKQKSNNEIFTNPDAKWWMGEPANSNFDTEKDIVKLDAGYDNKKLLLKASYNYIDSKLTEKGYEDKTVPLVSKHNIKATAGYRFSNGLGLYYDIRYYSSFYKGNDYKNIDAKMGGYAVSDFKIDFVKKNYELFLKVNNLFDKEYYDYVYYSAFGSGYYPSPTRNFLAGATVKF